MRFILFLLSWGLRSHSHPQLRIGMYADRQTSVPSPAPRLRRLSSPETSGSDIRKAQGQARQTQRAPRPSKNRVFGLLGHTTGQTSGSNPAFLKKFHEVPRQELTSGEQKANIVKSVRYGPTPRQPRSGDAEQGEPQGTPRDSRAS
jgi:hypothetical protein